MLFAWLGDEINPLANHFREGRLIAAYDIAPSANFISGADRHGALRTDEYAGHTFSISGNICATVRCLECDTGAMQVLQYSYFDINVARYLQWAQP